MLDYLKFTLWPTVKVKSRYYWWVIRYCGKRNIPPELIFGQIAKSMERMKENLMQALRHLPPDMGAEEKKTLLDAIGKADELDKKQREFGRRAQEKSATPH
ncbi:MAG: hypothetical protein AAB699_03340 [Patescibacteria group bacterium]